MGWLSALYLARSVDSSLARHTAPPRGPRTSDEVALILGAIAGVTFLVGAGIVLELLGVNEVPLLGVFGAVVVAMLVAGTVIGFLTSSVNRTFDGDKHES